MEQLFMTTVNLSLAASALGLVLLVLRAVLCRRLPRRVFYIAWVLVAVRLLLPVSLPSSYSFYNLLPPQATDTHRLTLVQDSGEVVNFPTLQAPPPQSAVGKAPSKMATVAPAPVPVVTILATVWLCGVLLFTGYSLLCYGYTRHRLAQGKLLEHCTVGRRQIAVVQCTLFASPVVCGVLRPVIVLPADTAADTAALVLAHECTHIRRLDNLWQGIATLLLYLHWFNPFAWVLHRCFVADMEISCDEAVCRTQPPRAYAAALVALAEQNTNRLAGGFLAFGESFLAERVRSVLHSKRLTVRLLLATSAVGLGLAVVFLTNPARPAQTPPSSVQISPPPSSTTSTAPAIAPAETQTPSSGSDVASSLSKASSAPPALPTVTYREGNPDWLSIDPAKVQTATLIDKQNRLAVRVPTSELYTIANKLNSIEPIPYEGTLDGEGNLRLLQLRLVDGNKCEYLLYEHALVYGNTAIAIDSSDSLYEQLPQCGKLSKAGWGNAMPEWLGYMNPLRISSVTVQAGERKAELTTQDSAAARDDILWLASRLCAVDTPIAGERLDEVDQVNDNAELIITMNFLDSGDRYTIELYGQVDIISVKAQSMGYTLVYRMQAGAAQQLIKSVSGRLLG